MDKLGPPNIEQNHVLACCQRFRLCTEPLQQGRISRVSYGALGTPDCCGRCEMRGRLDRNNFRKQWIQQNQDVAHRIAQYVYWWCISVTTKYLRQINLKEEREGNQEGGRGEKEVQKELKFVTYVYQLHTMNIKIICCKHALIIKDNGFRDFSQWLLAMLPVACGSTIYHGRSVGCNCWLHGSQKGGKEKEKGREI